MIQHDPKLVEIVRLIVDAVHPTRIYLFGSRARGDKREDSDYDLLLIYDGPLDKREVKINVRRALPSDISFDIFTLSSYEMERYKHVATTLQREVSQNGKVIYG